MASLYGAGYGAGRILEGATGGAVRGSLVNIQREEAQKSRDFRSGEATKTREFRSGEAEKTRESNKQAAEIKRRSQAFSEAFEAGSNAPVGSRKKIYESYYKATLPGEKPPTVEFDKTGDGAKLTLPNGTIIGGKTAEIGIMSRAIASGEDPNEVLNMAINAPGSSINVEKFGKAEDGAGGAGRQTPAQQMTQLKLDAWDAFYKNTATPQQQALIGVDRDPLLIEAAKAVNSDLRMAMLPIDQKVQKMFEIVELIRNKGVAAAADPAAGGDQAQRVQVISPDGTTGSVPASQLQDALKQGFKQAQ